MKEPLCLPRLCFSILCVAAKVKMEIKICNDDITNNYGKAIFYRQNDIRFCNDNMIKLRF